MQSGKQTWKHQVKTSLEAEHCIRFPPTVLFVIHPVHPVAVHRPWDTFRAPVPRVSVSSPVCVPACNTQTDEDWLIKLKITFLFLVVSSGKNVGKGRG
ncbi:hypothetical protein XENOCAPTIV_004095 [Xenoophorus captivus]|uniref:Uncharacterized protein n=2 Tax=Goodeidae TaxID=28758 RepID=A0ABV0RK24_9TELE